MREVGPQAVRMFVEAAVASGVSLERLLSGVPLAVTDVTPESPRALWRRGVRIDWDAFAAMHDNLARALPAGLSLEEFGARMVRAPSNEFLRSMARRVTSARALYSAAVRWFGPAAFPHLELRLHPLGPDRLYVEASIPASYRDSANFFRVASGIGQQLPALCGLPPARVDSSISSHRATHVVHLPQDRSLMHRARLFLRSALMVRGTLEEFARQRGELEAGLHALAQSRRDFRDVLDKIPGIIAIHRAGRLVWINQMTRDVLGLTEQAVPGTSLFDCVHPDDHKMVRDRLAMPWDGTPRSATVRVLRKDGGVMVAEFAQTQQIEFDGETARVVIGIDISERVRLQEQLLTSDRLASLGMVAAGVAHEINNPLTWVSLQTDLALRTLDGARRTGVEQAIDNARESLQIAREGLERVRGIVADLKTFSRADDEPLGDVDLRELIDAAVTLAGAEVRQRAQLVVEHGDVPEVRASRARLGQVLLNLLLNAVEAIPDGNTDKNVVRVRTSDAGDRVAIDVSDSGVGVPLDLRQRVFDPFFTTKPLGKGTGLGLSICRTLVSRMGGEIVIVTTSDALPGKLPFRTTFRVTIAKAHGDDREAPESRAAAPVKDDVRARVLVIDDEPQLASVLRQLLSPQHDVVVAGTGEAALEILRRDPAFDVVLCDLMMSGVDGIALFEALRAENPALAERVVFMTGGAFTRRARSFLASVPNVCLDKPIQGETLLQLVRARTRR